MPAFDPTSAGFVRLRDFQFPGGIDVYEYCNHAAVDGQADILRLNIYLSRDGSYVTIWNGLIEPTMMESKFDLPGGQQDLRFQDLYCETLFRGHVELADEAAIILNALRIAGGRYAVPQVLTGAPHDLRCEPLPTQETMLKARLAGNLTDEERALADAAVVPPVSLRDQDLHAATRLSAQLINDGANLWGDERVEAVARAMFRIEQEITAVDGDKLPDRHFKVAISRYLGMATAAITTLAGMARDKC